MKEFQKIIENYEQITQQQAALATVVNVEGSSYRRPGARMLITDDGKWTGAISGGCLEGDALRKAREVILSGKSRKITYDTMDDAGATSLSVGLGCNGIIDVYLEPIDVKDLNNPVEMIKTFMQIKKPSVLGTIYSGEGIFQRLIGQRLMVDEHETLYETITNLEIKERILADADELLRSNKSIAKIYQANQDKLEVFFEYLQPEINLTIFGAGYDVNPVLELAQNVGWQVMITEDCLAKVVPSRFPMADKLQHLDRAQLMEKLSFKDNSAVLIMSHNLNYDTEVLSQLFSYVEKTESIKYIGILGPGKRTEKMLNKIADRGILLNEGLLQKIHSPVGLDIGAELPEEIAVSIIGEIKAVFTERSGGFLKERTGFIHQRIQNKHIEAI